LKNDFEIHQAEKFIQVIPLIEDLGHILKGRIG
jgi:hypothetical protein